MIVLLASFPSADKVYTALAAVGLAVAALVIDMLRSWLQQWRETRKKAKQSSFVYLAEKQVLLDQGAERICLESKCDHVGLYRLHNGEFFEGDDSIKKMSMASEAVGGRGQARWKDKSQNLLMSNFPHLVLALDGPSKQPFYYITPENVLDFEIGRHMNDRNYKVVVALLIRGKKERPLAMLFLAWHTPGITLDKLNVAELEEHRRDLSYTLSD